MKILCYGLKSHFQGTQKLSRFGGGKEYLHINVDDIIWDFDL